MFVTSYRQFAKLPQNQGKDPKQLEKEWLFEVNNNITPMITGIPSTGMGPAGGSGQGQNSSGGGSSPSTPLLLDSYSSGLHSVYSYNRRLLSSYTGPLFKVRRDSDNAELDIPYLSNNEVDEITLSTFAAGTNATIIRVYDQSPNGYHLSNTISFCQPLIVSSGTIIKKNTKLAPYFDGSNDNLSTPNTPPWTTPGIPSNSGTTHAGTLLVGVEDYTPNVLNRINNGELHTMFSIPSNTYSSGFGTWGLKFYTTSPTTVKFNYRDGVSTSNYLSPNITVPDSTNTIIGSLWKVGTQTNPLVNNTPLTSTASGPSWTNNGTSMHMGMGIDNVSSPTYCYWKGWAQEVINFISTNSSDPFVTNQGTLHTALNMYYNAY